MKKYLMLFFKPYKLIYILPVLFFGIVIITYFIKISDFTSFIAGISTGFYSGVFWVVLINNIKNNGPFMNQNLLYSLPLKKRKLILPWIISNQLSLMLIFATILLGVYVSSMIKSANNMQSTSYLSISLLGIIVCLLFNLQLPLSFKPKHYLIYSAFLFIIGIILLYSSQYLLKDVLLSGLLKAVFFAILISVYILSGIWSYKKSVKYISS